MFNENLQIKQSKKVVENTHQVQRLRGGGMETLEEARLRAGAPSKSPIAECQEVMEQFDKVLEEYKKALAPCGQLTCNFAPNITETMCGKTCVQSDNKISSGGCGLPQCEYAKYKSGLMALDADVEKQFIGPAILRNCGHPKCTFISEPILPPIHWDCPDPLPSGKCKNPQCPYRFRDMKNESKIASAKGPCGNSQCPYVIPAPCDSPNCPFRNLNTKKVTLNIGKDSRARCPFANPPTTINMMEICNNPNCEYLNSLKNQFEGDCGEKSTLCNSPNCPYKNNLKTQCPNPECPFAEKQMAKSKSGLCMNPNCPKKKQGNDTKICSRPNCPHAISQPAKSGSVCLSPNCPKKKQMKVLRICSSPNCPYTKKICSNPDCPHAKTQMTGSSTLCSNPNCPMKNQENVTRICSSPDCPYAKKICSNPDCPHAKTQMTGSSTLCANPNCPMKNQENVTRICSSPDCPYAKKICSNPDCPYAKKICSNPDFPNTQNICSNPDCPYAKKISSSPDYPNVKKTCSHPDCPYAKKESKTPSICSNPNVNSQEVASVISSICGNPECVFNEKTSKSASKEAVKEEACANPECPFNIPSLESCKNPECPFKSGSQQTTESDESCDNPECPFKKGSEGSELSECECDNPTCPAKRETCTNPACPFNLRGYGPCTNPNCPNRTTALGRDLCFCATPDPSFNEFCTDKICIFHDPKKDTESKNVYVTKQLSGDIKIEEGALEYKTGDRLSTYDMAPCNLTTCKFMGGNLKCVDCGVGPDGKKRGPCPKTCPGDPICPLATAKKARKSFRRKDPSFKRTCLRMKETCPHDHDYPGYHIGHRECVIPFFYVPGRMGWLWNIHTPCLNLKPRRGWRPGAVTKAVARLIAKHRAAQTANPQEAKKKIKKKDEMEDGDMIFVKPTLEVKKREGIYHITMNPLKEPDTVQMNQNPYVDCTPMQFKVAKNNLNDPDALCFDEGEQYKSNSSSDDEIDVEVTTPAGVIHPDRPTQKKDIRVKQNQYDLNDLIGAKKNKDKEKEKDKHKEKDKDKDKEKDKDKDKDKEKDKDKDKDKDKEKGKEKGKEKDKEKDTADKEKDKGNKGKKKK